MLWLLLPIPRLRGTTIVGGGNCTKQAMHHAQFSSWLASQSGAEWAGACHVVLHTALELETPMLPPRHYKPLAPLDSLAAGIQAMCEDIALAAGTAATAVAAQQRRQQQRQQQPQQQPQPQHAVQQPLSGQELRLELSRVPLLCVDAKPPTRPAPDTTLPPALPARPAATVV